MSWTSCRFKMLCNWWICGRLWSLQIGLLNQRTSPPILLICTMIITSRTSSLTWLQRSSSRTSSSRMTRVRVNVSFIRSSVPIRSWGSGPASPGSRVATNGLSPRSVRRVTSVRAVGPVGVFPKAPPASVCPTATVRNVATTAAMGVAGIVMPTRCVSRGNVSASLIVPVRSVVMTAAVGNVASALVPRMRVLPGSVSASPPVKARNVGMMAVTAGVEPVSATTSVTPTSSASGSLRFAPMSGARFRPASISWGRRKTRFVPAWTRPGGRW